MNKVRNMQRLLSLLVLIFLCVSHSQAQRMKFTINSNWSFSLQEEDASSVNYNTKGWEKVSFPHTWNAKDSDDEIPGYFRGKGWYRNTIDIDRDLAKEHVYVFFEGANQETDLFINGKYVGNHKGGYTAFSFDITKFLNKGKNTIAISVDNTLNNNITPLGGDFTMFGGIYRDVYLLYTPKAHISTTHYASSGVYLDAYQITDKEAKIKSRTYLSNATDKSQRYYLKTQVQDADGNIVAEKNNPITIPEKSENILFQTDLSIKKPKLWNTDAPYLYRVFTYLYDSNNKVIDCVSNPLGLRTIKFDPDKGFFINGQPCKLMGTSRHQDYVGWGNALKDEMHIRDIKMIKDLGAKFIRISHYPQDPFVIEQCNNLGILSSIEIPIINNITMSEEYTKNCIDQVTEMVYQSYNSPSVVVWAYMNEILLNQVYKKNKEIEKNKYLKELYNLAYSIEQKIRSIDDSRYTMIACHNAPALYKEAGLTDIPKILGFNIYYGWYGSNIHDIKSVLDEIKIMFPNKPLILTEYGAGVDSRIHSFDPERYDFSNEYGSYFHEYYIPVLQERDFVSGSAVWNFNDFSSERRKEATPHVNNKGLVGTDRECKDTYYLYKAYLSDSPVLHICGDFWECRAGASIDGETSTQPLKIYTNAEKVKITANGKDLGEYDVKDRKAELTIPFINGINRIEAQIVYDGEVIKEQYICDFRCINVKHNFTEMSIMLGSKRYFEDKTGNICWIPEKEYTEGSWGYVGGRPIVNKVPFGTSSASTKEIFGTDQDPIFQTQREGIEQFKADIPNGKYSVYLYFSELLSKENNEKLLYNLDPNQTDKRYSNRVFSIYINGQCVRKDFNIAEEYGINRAVIIKYEIDVFDNKGLTVSFEEKESTPVLNAIRIVKN